MSVETYANILCVVSFSLIKTKPSLIAIYHTLTRRESENLKLPFSLSWKMGWRQSKESFQHVLHSSYPCSGPTRARPCALLRPFIIDYVLSCNKASQSNPPNKRDWYTELRTKDGAAAISHQTEQNPRRRGCPGHTWCWTGICTSDVASPSKSGPNHCHTVFCRIFDSKFEGVSLLADSCECRLWPSRLLCHTRSVNGKRDMAKHKRFCMGRP